MTPIISIIVPIYNAEKYLHQCIDSLLNQGLKTEEYEIILVNDGSTDKSLSICEHYKSLNSNITIINQSNKGLSSARNIGINNAIGSYICFVDADDYLVTNGLNHIINSFCLEKCDILRFWPTILYNKEDNNTNWKGELRFQGNGYEFIEKYGLDTFCVIWLYNRNYIVNNKLLFTDYKLCEDFHFVSRLLLTNPRIISTSANIYRYIIHKNSLTTTRSLDYTRRCVNDFLEAIFEIYNHIYNLKDTNPKVYYNCLQTFESKAIIIYSRILSANYNKEDFNKTISRLRFLLQLSKLNSPNKYQFLIKISCSTYFSYVLSSYLYIKIFVPYILPKLNRNK